MVAVPILFGRLTAEDYEDAVAIDKRIDQLRDRIVCVEDKQFTKDYHDPDKRSIANSVQVFFQDGRATERVEVQYPVGHRRRRAEGKPLLVKKFKQNAGSRFPANQVERILDVFENRQRLEQMPVNEFVDLFVCQ